MNPTNNCYLCKLRPLITLLKTWFIGFFFFIPFFSFSQTTNISGIVNSYYNVLGVDATKNALKLDNVSGLAYGNTVLIIQMKGATVNTTATSSSFGDVTSMNYAGNYEVATICSVSSDSVYFFNTILNSYDVSYKVQLIKFAEYYSANVTDTVRAQLWSNTTGKGGVLAIKVEEDLILNAPLFADTAGYKGGRFYPNSGTCGFFQPVGNAYAYDPTATSQFNGGNKGEGIADVATSIAGGRGALANGGGGGNNHNNGGGGGSNLTAGGNGGGNFSTGPVGCTGNYQGLGAKALTNATGTKIFLGGGGGAGHANSTTQPYAGGNGGGIIIVFAKNIIGNGKKITANGQNGKSTTYDGASGGGAGGTIIMNVTNSYSGALTIQANGGNGGNEDDDLISGRCFGAGGGGSGGVIYFNDFVPAISPFVDHGTAGINIDPSSCGTPVPAVNGTDGSIVPNYSYKTSTTPSSSCSGALPVRIIYFNASLVNNQKVKLEWDIANPEEAMSFSIEKMNAFNNWIELKTIGALANLHHYESFDANPNAGENIYRLKIKTKDNQVVYSTQKRVTIKYNDHFSVFPNPATSKITIMGKLNVGSVIRLTDIGGKQIKQTNINNSSSSVGLVLPALLPGIYLLTIDNYTEKIVILH